MTELSKDVYLFAEAQERKLQANDWKIPYDELSIKACIDMLDKEILELKQAVEIGGDVGQDVLGEAVDVANFAMFIAKLTGSLKSENINEREIEWRAKIPEGWQKRRIRV